MRSETVAGRPGTVGDGDGTRRTLPGGSVLSVDRRLPFLLVHRAPAKGRDAGTARLISGEAAWLRGEREDEAEVRERVAELARAGSAAHGAFLVLEVWGARDPASRVFRVHGPRGPAPCPSVPPPV